MNKQKAEKTTIHLKTKVLTLEIKDFGSSDIDVEDLLVIDYNNIICDILTFPVIFNRISNIKSEIDALLREVQLDFSIFEAQLYQDHKKKFIRDGEKVTESALEASIKLDPKYKVKKYEVFQVQKQADIIDGLYWSAKSKDKKLDNISAKIQPDEFEKDILEATINSVQIRAHKNYFENKR